MSKLPPFLAWLRNVYGTKSFVGWLRKVRRVKADPLYRQQIAVSEQKVILKALAEACARENIHILEIGSWCGDSAVELGEIARKHGGKLVCIDWWKGNIGTNLANAAANSDIFSVFWQRIVNAGLEDTVIPIRAKSDDAAVLLRYGMFDMIYIDGDHRYGQVVLDIKNYAPFLRDGGILCGDDCEGRPEDFDPRFLATGKDVDYHETVHCGVVLAVSEFLEKYSINYNIWSVRRSGGEWLPTERMFDGIQPRRQYHPPLIESYAGYNLIRYGKNIWAAPQAIGAIDFTQEADRARPEVLSAPSLQEIRKLIDDFIKTPR